MAGSGSVEPRPYDAAVVAALSDAWYPAIFTRLTERLGVPTVDLTVHLRSIHALEQMRPDDWMAVRFRTTVANEGFLEEDGQLWAPDGTLDRPLPPARSAARHLTSPVLDRRRRTGARGHDVRGRLDADVRGRTRQMRRPGFAYSS